MSEAIDNPQLGANPNGPRSGPGRLLGWFALLFVVFLLLGLYNLAQRRNAERVLAQQTDRMAVPYVAVIHAAQLDEDSQLALPGTLSAYVQSPIYARTNGYLKKWYKDIGGHVKQGELLAQIETPEVDQELAKARADLALAQANLKLAGITAARYKDLLKSDAVSKQEVDNYTSDLAAKQAMVQSAQANVKRLEDLESFKRVYAPFSGVITQRNVDIGNLISAGSGSNAKELFDLAQTDPMRVYVNVPQSYAPSIHSGGKACLELMEFPGRKFCGHVVRTAEAIDPATRTLLTEVDVPNASGTLLPGAYAQVDFEAKLSGQRLTLPINALLFRPEGTTVAVVGADSQITLKRISIGRDFGTRVEVLDGISPKDTIVINPADSLEQGEKVNVAAQNAESGSAGPQKAKQ